MSEDVQDELPTLDDLETSIQDLKQLHQLRGKISAQLGSLATKLEVRRKIVEHLYDLFEIVGEDMDALLNGAVTDQFEIYEMGDGFKANNRHLDEVLERAREKLLLQVKVSEEHRLFEEIVDHQLYAGNAELRLAQKVILE